MASSLFGRSWAALAADFGNREFVRREFNAAALPVYMPPSPVAISATAEFGDAERGARSATGALPRSRSASVPAPAAPQVTVNVTAMDSQSFMDHSNDIANAVREAMLNMHPINGVVATLTDGNLPDFEDRRSRAVSARSRRSVLDPGRPVHGWKPAEIQAVRDRDCGDGP